MQKIINELREAARQYIDHDTELKDDTLLFDLGIDSIDYISLIVALENKYNIEFDDDYLANDKQTINSLATFLSQYVSGKNTEKR